MPRLPAFLLLLFTTTLFCLAGERIEVQLKNGDRLTGDLISKEEGEVVIKSAVLGRLQIPADEVVSITPIKPKPDLPASAGATASGTTAPAKVAAKAPAPKWKQILRKTTGTLEFGLNQQSGRTDAVNATFRGDAEYVAGDDKYNLDLKYYYGRYAGVLQTDRHDSSFQWRHDLSKRTFVQSETSYTVDHIKQIDFNFEQSAGAGVIAIKGVRQVMNLGGGFTEQYRKAFGYDAGLLTLGDAFEDYTLKFNDRVNLKQAASFQYSPIGRQSYTLLNGKMVLTDDQASNYSVRFNAALQSKLTERLSLNLHYELEYDNVILDPTLKMDQHISSTLGYTF